MDRATHYVGAEWFQHSSAPRVNTNAYIYNAIKTCHPQADITCAPEYGQNIRAWAARTSEAEVASVDDNENSGAAASDAAPAADTNNLADSVPPIPPNIWARKLAWTVFVPPEKRMNGGGGAVADYSIFDTYLLRWKGYEFLIYLVDERDVATYPVPQRHQFIVSDSSDASSLARSLIQTVGRWESVLHDEIWVFNQGWWGKDADLYRSIMKSEWKNVILPSEMKNDIVNTATRFFNSQEQYQRLGVPWKRGVIFYGPPGNGKTISIKATMHTLYERADPVPTLYVKTLASFAGPEYSIEMIFDKARREAPCYLVFEDLDSLVTDQVRSFFLNAVDGLSSNDGILMIGSTNHLDRLDPGIARRPSRFDRKYLFPNPGFDERVQYAKFWRDKILKNQDEDEKGEDADEKMEKEKEQTLEFPLELCPPIARLTNGFSFAYIQEAFVSSLLTIVNESEDDDDGHKRESDGVKKEEEYDHSGADGNEDEDEEWDVVRTPASTSSSDDSDTMTTTQSLEELKLAEEKGVRKEKKEKKGKDGDQDQDKEFEKYRLWRVLKVQIGNLRKELEEEEGEEKGEEKENKGEKKKTKK